MFFANLPELKTLMHGHGVACLQLGLITDDSATFNASFVRWLVATKGGSASSGWGVAIEELARAAGIDAVGLFFEFVGEFFDFWGERDEHSGGH